jgi:hypothetical protein
MHKQTGWPIFAWLECMETGTALCHAFVSPDGGATAIDVKGDRSAQGLLDDFDPWDPFLVKMTKRSLMKIADDRSSTDESLLRDLEAARTVVHAVLDLLPEELKSQAALTARGKRRRTSVPR